MRILTVGNMYPPHHLGGYEQDWAAGVAALQAVGHDVKVLVSDHREAGVAEQDPPFVERTLRWYWHDHEFPTRSFFERLGVQRHNRATLASALDQFQPDLVSWWPMGGMSMALLEQVRRAPIPAVGVVYDDWMVYGPMVDAWHASWVPTRIDFDRAARWYFASDSVRKAAPVDGELLPPGLDEVFLAPAPERDWQWKLLAPGRIDPRKGLATAIGAVAQLPRARLEIIGSGDSAHRAELDALVERVGVADRVVFSPPRPRPELAAAYADCDAVVFPVIWSEPFGLVPLEAMGIGRPVVASGRGGSGEFLRDGENCLLHEAEDAASLAAALQRLADDAGLRARLREGGFKTAPQFARSKWDERVVAIHEAAV
jgi:glycosyltransferase involved in cell wall biosynthesis